MSNRIRPILLALKTRVEALGLSVGGTTLPVFIRKAPVRRQQMDPVRAVTISKSRTPEQTTRRRFGLWQTAYTFDVTVVAPYAGPDADTSDLEASRDSILDALKKPPLPGADDVFDMDAQPADWLSPLGDDTGWDWHAVQVTATVAHA